MEITRDEFALHAPEPGIAELAGILNMQNVPFEPYQVTGEQMKRGIISVREHYEKLSLGEKLMAIAHFKFAYADAMLRASKMFFDFLPSHQDDPCL